MNVSNIYLRNWRNFREVDLALGNRLFIVGPNASGKSNFLDVFRFLRDIVKPGGGLQKAISDRGGISKLRCLAARKENDIAITLLLSESSEQGSTWCYELSIKQEPRGRRQPQIVHERVLRGEEVVLERPLPEDKKDALRLTQTHLEQIHANQKFRPIYEFLGSISYLHLIPQMLRYPDAFAAHDLPGDPFGRNFMDHLAATGQRTREARLRKIEGALRVAVPQLSGLGFVKDDRGVPHLEAAYKHWRHFDAKQREDQFSDGTLRLIGLLWSLLESDSLMLLEEPELSLHPRLVAQIPGLMHKLQAKRRRQVFVSTHSPDLLQNPGIGPEEVLLLTPGENGTTITLAADDSEILALLVEGFSMAEAALPKAAPKDVEQLSFEFNG